MWQQWSVRIPHPTSMDEHLPVVSMAEDALETSVVASSGLLDSALAHVVVSTGESSGPSMPHEKRASTES